MGEYEPYAGAHILVVTSDALKSNAAKSPFGAYGAIQRISLTETGKELQIACTNPLYMAQIYQMKGDLADVTAKLQTALGKAEEFGSKKGLKASSLRAYHYMVFMPYFTDQVKLASMGPMMRRSRRSRLVWPRAKGVPSRYTALIFPASRSLCSAWG